VSLGEDEGLAVGAGDAGRGERGGEEVADAADGDGPVLQAGGPLEQQGHGRVPGALVGVVGGGERDGPVGAADAGDDRGQGVGEFGADDEEPFGVGLGRGDGQQGDELAGGGEAVLDQAVVGELGEFLDPDAFSRGPFLVAWCCASNSFSGVSRRVFQGVVDVTDSSYCCSGR
jgi:hypothetical protein